MFEFFNTVTGYLEAYWNYTVEMMDTVIASVTYLAGSLGIGQALAGFMPGVIGVAVTCMTSIAILKALTNIL